MHVPYLVAIGLCALGQAGSAWLAIGETPMNVVEALGIATWGLHLLWLYALFADAERFLAGAQVMTAARVALFAILSCVLLPLWTAFALMVLLRTAHNVLAEKKRELPGSLVRYARDAPALFAVGALLLGVWVVVVWQIEQVLRVRGDPGTDLSGFRMSADVGDLNSALAAVFYVASMGYYLHFVARAVPALYRSYAVLGGVMQGRKR